MATEVPPFSGMVPVEDTELALTDTGGTGRAVVYLNGSYSSQRHWRRTMAELGTGWRHLTYDERARGRSKRSADYSFAACVRDIDAVLTARSVERPILVGWSYGAAVAVQWAVENPTRATGIVSVDGAYPYDWINDENRERIRKLFRRLSPLFPIARPLGLAAKMSAADHAEINIELNEIVAGFRPVLESLAVPTRWVVGSDASLGATTQESTEFRATLSPVLERNPNVRVSETVKSNHGQILRKDFRAVAAAVREVASVSGDPDASTAVR